MINYLLKKRKLTYTLLAVYWALIFMGTSLPSAAMPALGVGDKFKHFFAYMGLAFLLAVTLKLQNKFVLLKKYTDAAVLIIVPFYGMLDEIHQLFIPGRSCDLLDWVADVSGCILGIILYRYVINKKRESLAG